MPVRVITGDITKIRADAIVNPTNGGMYASDGTGAYSYHATGMNADYQVHMAAGPGMEKEIEGLRRMKSCEVRVTGGYGLPCRNVFHVYGPEWDKYAAAPGGEAMAAAYLKSAYTECMRMAEAYKCESIAFPLISSGTYGYPKDMVLRIAMDATGEYLAVHNSDMLVTIVVYSRDQYVIDSSVKVEIDARIKVECVENEIICADFCEENEAFRADSRACRNVTGRRYSSEHEPLKLYRRKESAEAARECDNSIDREYSIEPCPCKTSVMPAPDGLAMKCCKNEPLPLKVQITEIDESWQQCLLRLIAEKGMKNSECYNRANVTKACFSKIKQDEMYRPKKTTVCAFAAALNLSVDETTAFLDKAGYSLSRSIKFDIIVRYCFEKGKYNVMEINEILYDYDQQLLGSF